MKLPAGVSEQSFAQAIAAFKVAIGAEWVFTSDEDVALYRDAYSPFKGEEQERLASAAVAPSSAEQVQEIVRIAGRFGVPLYPISTGKNLGYGGSAPAYSGCVVVDLKRMNRIIEVNEENAFALVEPGVSYFDLYNYIKEKGLKVWIDCPDPGWGSVVGNALDRGGGYTMPQFRNHFDAHCGMEVVLPNGELLRTGMGAMPTAETWQQYKSGFGPWVDGIFSQSNFGIVTKMGFWLMPEPEALTKVKVNVYRYADLEPLIDILNYAENSRIFTGFPDLHSPLLGSSAVADLIKLNANGFAPAPPELMKLRQGAKLGYSAELDAYAMRTRTPYWTLNMVCYGPVELLDGARAALKRLFSKITDSTFEPGETLVTPLNEEQMEKAHNTEIGVPSLKIFGLGARNNWNPMPPTSGHVWFSPLVPRSAKAIIEANKVLGAAIAELGLPQFSSFNIPMFSWERAAMYIIGFAISDDPQKNAAMRDKFAQLVHTAASHGWGEYRTTPAFQDVVMETYSFNNNALLHFHETLKDAIDPKGIISPGRYGIWPQNLRKGRK